MTGPPRPLYGPEVAGVPEQMYPCDRCGKLRTKAEGGTTFTVCDSCWDELHPKSPSLLSVRRRLAAAYQGTTPDEMRIRDCTVPIAFVVEAHNSAKDILAALDELERLREENYELRQMFIKGGICSGDKEINEWLDERAELATAKARLVEAVGLLRESENWLASTKVIAAIQKFLSHFPQEPSR